MRAKALKELLIFWLTKVGVKFSGPLGWAASTLIGQLAKWLNKVITKKVKDGKFWWDNKRQSAKDKIAHEKYQETLKDGQSEQAQIDATLDLINGPKS